MKWWPVLALVLAVLVLGCTQTNLNQPNQSNQPASEVNQSFLKDIVVGDNKVVLVYVFPDAGYNVSVLGYRVGNKTLVIYTQLIHREPAAQVITHINKTIFLNTTGIKTVIVYTLRRGGGV